MGRSDLALGLVGAGLLVAGLFLVAGGLPTYATEVTATASDVDGLAEQTERYAVVDIDPIPFSALSPAERTAVRDARQSPGRATAGPDALEAGPTFEYRNDVTNEYFVRYGEEVQLVRVVVEIGYVRIGLGMAAVVIGGLLVVAGAWSARTG